MLDKILSTARVAAFALTAGLGLASGASASTLDFVIDATNSSVSLIETSSNRLCRLTACSVNAELASSLTDGDTYTIGTGDIATFDFITFSGTSTGRSNFSISAVLSFLAPSGISGVGTGSGTALLLAGYILEGALSWTSVSLLGTLPSGSIAQFGLQGGSGLFLGDSITTTASIKGISIVPLPAGGLLLLGAMGGLAALRRRKAQVAA